MWWWCPSAAGGLISGVAFAIKQMNPRVRVYGVQAQGAPSMLNAVQDDQIETLGNGADHCRRYRCKDPRQ